jgi:hypothetical protein
MYLHHLRCVQSLVDCFPLENSQVVRELQAFVDSLVEQVTRMLEVKLVEACVGSRELAVMEVQLQETQVRSQHL